MALRERIKWLLFPGLNLHARLRRRVLPPFFGHGGTVLDAGCGNGMLAWESYRKGNRVTGISIKEGEVDRCRKLFHEYLGVTGERLRFLVHNIYELEALDLEPDEIICTEVLEHIEEDEKVCRMFFEVLKPGGVLHLCCPNAEHPDHARQALDAEEAGGHVRAGYTFAEYRRMLEPLGFEIAEERGLGGPVRQWFSKRIIRCEERFGFLPALLLFFFALPFLPFDPRNPEVPYSIYVRARKNEEEGGRRPPAGDEQGENRRPSETASHIGAPTRATPHP